MHVGFDPDSGEFSVGVIVLYGCVALHILGHIMLTMLVACRVLLVAWLMVAGCCCRSPPQLTTLQGLPDQWSTLLQVSGISKKEIAKNPQKMLDVLGFYTEETQMGKSESEKFMTLRKKGLTAHACE